MFVPLELALFIEFGEQVFGFVGLLRLGLLELKSLLKLSVLLLQLFCPLLLTNILFLQLCKLCSSPSSFGADLEHVYSLAIGRCTN